MATLDEVISQMSEEDYFSDPIQFIIDNDLRIVSIPDRGVVAGVVGDKNVNRINFQMPRYYNRFDMSKFKTRINYVNAEGNLNYYTVTDSTIKDDLLIFSWLVDADVVAYVGTVAFSVNMVFTDENGVTKQAFNTSDAGRLKVLEGIQVDKYISYEQQVDLISKLEADLAKYISSGINQIQDEGAKVKKSLPEDYVKMTEDVTSLKEDLTESDAFYNDILQIKNTINMLNPDKLQIGKAIDSSGNVIDGASNRSVSNLIEVDPSIPLRITTDLFQTLCQYDTNEKKITETLEFSSAKPINLRENTKFVRAYVWNKTLPFMLYQSDKILSYIDYGRHSDNIRKKVDIYTSDTEEEIYLKLYDAYKTKNCDIYWERGTYEFSTIFEIIKTKYGRSTAYELPIGGNCRYFFNGSMIKAYAVSSDSNVLENESLFGSWRESGSYELHDGILEATGMVYVIHDEANGLEEPYVRKYKNMRMRYNTDTSKRANGFCLGGGTGLNGCIEFDGCVFDTNSISTVDGGYHGHSKDAISTFNVLVKNCYFSKTFQKGQLSTNETAKLVFTGNSALLIPDTDSKWDVIAWNNETHS